MNERELEDLLFLHSYLIDEKFANLKPRKLNRQTIFGRNRLDLLFESDEGLTVCELKITPLVARDIEQLSRYCKFLENKHQLTAPHFLIGKRPARADVFDAALKNSDFLIKPFFLGADLAQNLVMDDKTRRYRPLLPDEAAAQFLNLRF